MIKVVNLVSVIMASIVVQHTYTQHSFAKDIVIVVLEMSLVWAIWKSKQPVRELVVRDK